VVAGSRAREHLEEARRCELARALSCYTPVALCSLRAGFEGVAETGRIVGSEPHATRRARVAVLDVAVVVPLHASRVA
jgi:hypothetical protein